MELELSVVDRHELLVFIDKLGEQEHLVELKLVDKPEMVDKPELVVD